ncbi:MAG: cytochrome c, partial [Cytophagales bacterium]|nr:cytochrome c [Armatimonadota bacterium]
MLLRKPLLWAPGAAALFLIFASGLPGARAGQKGPKLAAKKADKPAMANAGARVFQDQCAPCHGAKGEGTEVYARALTGELSVGQLAKYIAKSMPPGPEVTTPADARMAAAYIHGAFYSPVAQERNRPARVALSRLTVRQLKNSVSDLVNTFRPPPSPGAERGLSAEYF